MKPQSLQQEQEEGDGHKKTRDLPNLTECHSCRLRIDTCSGKNRLQTLYSEWRIVLLCKNCFTLVESSQICSYCFHEKESSSDKSCFRCCQCERMVHKTCFSKYRTVAPWSYSCYSSDSQFSVCLDCWVPKYVASKRRRVFLTRSRKRQNDYCELGNSNFNCGERKNKSLEDVVKDANCTALKKIEVATRARDLAVRKVIAAKRVAELASNVLDLVANRGDDNAAAAAAADDDDNKELVVDDAELAFQLHRALNTSPRISKNLCPINSNCLVVPKMRMCGRDGEPLVSRSSSACRKVEVCTGYDSSSMNVNFLKSNGSNARISLTTEDGNMEVQLKEREGSCSKKLITSIRDDNITNSDSQSLKEGNDSISLEDDEKCNRKPGRCLIKYSRRKFNEALSPGERPKCLYERLLHETQALAAVLLGSCSKESISFSNTSLQSCTFSLQTSVCSSGLS